jgi:hypothetical protein
MEIGRLLQPSQRLLAIVADVRVGLSQRRCAPAIGCAANLASSISKLLAFIA